MTENNQDDNLEEFIDAMRDMSTFVYRFAALRNIVRENHETTKKKFIWFGEEKEYKFDTPALIITQEGAQEKSANAYLKYPITPNAILEFVAKNRRLLKEPNPGYGLEFDEDIVEDKGPFVLEEKFWDLSQNMKIIDYEDEFSTKGGGLVYAVVVNLTKRWVSVIFRGTVGATDALTDLNFAPNSECFFSNKTGVFVDGNEPATHSGFTKYLFDSRARGLDRSYYDRILSCVSDQFENNPEVKGQGFQLYVSGHSLGGGLANLFGFRVAQLKAMGHESVKHLPSRVKVLSFASPCVGNECYNKEFQYLEKEGILRHIRISTEGDVVPTNNIIAPFKFFLSGDTTEYTQNGVNMFLRNEGKMDISYRNTKSMESQYSHFNPMKSLEAHSLVRHEELMKLDENQKYYERTVEDLYKVAGNYEM